MTLTKEQKHFQVQISRMIEFCTAVLPSWILLRCVQKKNYLFLHGVETAVICVRGGARKRMLVAEIFVGFLCGSLA